MDKFINMLSMIIFTDLTNCGLVPPCGVEDFVAIGSCNGFLSKGTVSVYETKLIHYHMNL